MMRPKRAFIIGLAAARIRRKAASRLTADDRLPLLVLHAQDEIVARDAGIVDEDVELAAQRLDRRGHERVDRGRVRQVARQRRHDRRPARPQTLRASRHCCPKAPAVAPCAASALAIAEPMPPRAPVTSAVIPVRSNMPYCIPLPNSQSCLRKRLDIVHRHDAGRRRVRRDALDHRAEDLAAEFDELGDAGVAHRRDALAPAHRARSPAPPAACGSSPASVDRRGGDIGIDRQQRRRAMRPRPAPAPSRRRPAASAGNGRARTPAAARRA